MYRVGLTGSNSTDSKETVQEKARLAGYPNSTYMPGQPQFRPIPNRWFVWRTVRGAQGTKYNGQIWIKNRSDGTESQFIKYDSSQSETPAVRDCFVVESVSTMYSIIYKYCDHCGSRRTGEYKWIFASQCVP